MSGELSFRSPPEGRARCGYCGVRLGQELDAAGDVVVHVAGAVHFDRDVVGDVQALEYPGDEVRLP